MEKFTFSIIKPHLVEAGGIASVKQDIQNAGFKIVCSQEIQLSTGQVLLLYPHLKNLFKGNFIQTETIQANTSGVCETMVLHSNHDNTPSEFRKILGQVSLDGNTGFGLRGRYGEGQFRNGIHGADSAFDSIRELLIVSPNLFTSVLSLPEYSDEFFHFISRYGKKK